MITREENIVSNCNIFSGTVHRTKRETSAAQHVRELDLHLDLCCIQYQTPRYLISCVEIEHKRKMSAISPPVYLLSSSLLWKCVWPCTEPQSEKFILLRSLSTACKDWCVWHNAWVMMSTVISAVTTIIIISSMKWSGLNLMLKQTITANRGPCHAPRSPSIIYPGIIGIMRSIVLMAHQRETHLHVLAAYLANRTWWMFCRAACDISCDEHQPQLQLEKAWICPTAETLRASLTLTGSRHHWSL